MADEMFAHGIGFADEHCAHEQPCPECPMADAAERLSDDELDVIYRFASAIHYCSHKAKTCIEEAGTTAGIPPALLMLDKEIAATYERVSEVANVMHGVCAHILQERVRRSAEFPTEEEPTQL